MSNIRIDIASEFKDKGFKNAEKSTNKLNKSFTNLQRTATRTFVAIAGFRALKGAAAGFLAEDKAIKNLTQSLRNLGLAYNTVAIDEYLEKTEKATGINRDQLTPSFTQLVTTTLDANKSMKLLNVAMDISTSTGKDLGSVSTALSRAFNGNFAALGKVQTSYTTAELEAMGFSKTIQVLTDQFGGAAKANAETYSGQIELLKIALGDASDALGKGLIDGLVQLNNGNLTSGLENIVKIGEFIGDVFRRAGLSIRYAKEFLSTGWTISDEERRRLEEIRALFDNPMAATNRMANNPAANRQFLADYRKQQQLLKKIEEDRKKAAALAAKAEKERLKREKEAQQLKRAGTVFDMENIQIVAAMQGKLTEEQRLRLTALLAINNDNAEAAEKLTLAILASNKAAFEALGVTMKAGDSVETLIQKIVKAQTGILLVNSGITDIKKAKNPFEDWPDIIAGILAGISNVKKAVASIGGGTGSAAGVTDNAGGGGGAKAITPPVNSGSVSDWRRKEAQDAEDFPMPVPVSPEVSDEHLRRKAAAIPKVEPLPEIPGFGGGGGGGRGTQQILNLSVNVSGSVMTENDLVNSITNAIYNKQKSGQPINYTAAI